MSQSHYAARVSGRPVARATLVLAMLLSLSMSSGCSTLGYYWQAIDGQLDIWRRARPITSWLNDPDLPAATRARLERVESARSFAAEVLALQHSGSYGDYADLEREYVVWNVFAAPEFGLEPIQSCFLVAGCLDYRGFFDPGGAERFAQQLESEGHDVHVAGIAAYSTLGWFDDPVLNTYLHWPEFRLVGLIFHELAHQRVYVPDDSRFNESYATAVAAAGVDRWFEDRAALGLAAREQRQREAELNALLLETRNSLAEAYSETDDRARLAAAKARAFRTLREDYAALRTGWGGAGEFDQWMNAPWNNARLAAIATYHGLEPEFLALLNACGDDFERFHRAVEHIAVEPESQREIALRAAASAGTCPEP